MRSSYLCAALVGLMCSTTGGSAQPVAPEPQVVSPSQAVAPKPPSAAPAAVAIRGRLDDKPDRALQATPAEMKAVAAFYEARDGASLFAGPQGLTQKGKEIVAELSRADDWGLPAGELVPGRLPTDASSLSQTEVADVEVRLSLASLKYARFARGGRIPEPSKQLATYIDRTPQLVEPLNVLETLASAPSAGEALTKFHPQNPAFAALRAAYLESRKLGITDVPAHFPTGPSLKPGMRHPHVALVRKALKLPPPAPPADEMVMDADLVAAVAAFQSANGLERPDGVVGSKTRTALSNLAPPSAKKLLANMEQWRWMSEDLGATHVEVNIPDFTLRFYTPAGMVYTERVVTGLVTNQTPIFSENLQTVVLQPDWILPESIKVREALPSLMGRGGMFWSNGLRVKKGNTDVDPLSVNWNPTNIKNYTFYQPPGDKNVLGQVKFLFPNKHAVYMHDTPAKQLFNSSVRAYSHGCMRVRNPVKLAELILGMDKGWSPERVRELVESGPEDNKIALEHKIPVHVTYFTAIPDGTGKIKSLPDIYGHEQRISLALEGRWGEIDIPPDHLAPIEDREFEMRTASLDRRRGRDADDEDDYYQGSPYGGRYASPYGGRYNGRGPYASYGGGPKPIEKFFQSIFGGF